MSAEEEKLDAFFLAVAKVLGTKIAHFHHPTVECFVGSCKRSGIVQVAPYFQSCNWKGIHRLARDFYRHAPEVDRDWKHLARNNGFEPDYLHDIMLGVFIGSDQGKDRFNTRFFGIEPPEHVNNRCLLSPRHVPKTPTPKETT